MRLVGVVTAYHQGESSFENISTYIEGLDKLLIFDNNKDQRLKQEIERFGFKEKIYYVSFCKNLGVAYALNYALKNFHEYEYLLMMDQDSKFLEEDFSHYIEAIEDYMDDRVIIYAPYFDGKKTSEKYQLKKRVITSGSIVSVSKAIAIGGFDESLFIDEVDHEFCYRATRNKFLIVQCNTVSLVHHLGEKQPISIFGITKFVTNHSPSRRYYMVRNCLYVICKHPYATLVEFSYLKNLTFMMVAVFFFEKNRKKKFQYVIRGIKDFFFNRMGKMELK